MKYIFTKPPSIYTKQIPVTISKRIRNILSDKECFDKAAFNYNNALKNSSFNKNIKLTPPSPQKKTQQKHYMVQRLAAT